MGVWESHLLATAKITLSSIMGGKSFLVTPH